MQGTDDTQLIESLRQALDSLPDMVKQGVTQALGAAGSQRVQQQFVRCTPSAATQDNRTAEAMQQASAAKMQRQPKVDIPIPTVETSMKSMEGVWSEWKNGTATRAAICKLYQDHGRKWMSKEYGYNKQTWQRKRKLVLALKDHECVGHAEALQLLKTKMLGGVLLGVTALSRFTEKLPSVHADIHPDGKHTILDAGMTQITPEHASLYRRYQKALQRALCLRSSVSEY